MIRGPAGARFDRLILFAFWLGAGLLTILFAWRGNWAGIIWP